LRTVAEGEGEAEDDESDVEVVENSVGDMDAREEEGGVLRRFRENGKGDAQENVLVTERNERRDIREQTTKK